MSETTVDISGFNAGMAGLVRRLKLDPIVVVKKEAGELMKTLVRVTPPKDPSATRQRISKTVRSKFQAAGELQDHAGGGFGGKYGTGDTTWYAWSPQFLFGAAKELDLRKADMEQLRTLLYSLRKSGKQSYEFSRPRKNQKVLITQRVIANPSQINKLVTRIQKHVGRLKAGWLVAWSSGVIAITGSATPPQWVTRHARGAKGRYIDGLGVENFPQFSIGNSAVGIGDKKVKYFVQTALTIRAKAMAENARLIVSGKKHLADYAGGKVFVPKTT